MTNGECERFDIKTMRDWLNLIRQDYSNYLNAVIGYSDLIAFDDLIRLEADGCYTLIYIKGGKNKTVSRTLKEFEETLPQDNFFRAHKSHLINLKYVKDYSSFGGYYITMTDESKVELSRRKAPEFIQKIKAMLKTI